MRYIYLTLCFLVLSCSQTKKLKPEDTKVARSTDMQKEIDAVLARDAENKKLEREFLEEIRIAQDNNDSDAFRFFLTEYVNVQRMKLPDWIKEEPNYVRGGINVKY